MPPTEQHPFLHKTRTHKNSGHPAFKPRLYEGRQVSKDLHQWGQEETRKGNTSGRYADQKIIFFETRRCKYLYFVDKIPETQRQTICTHNLWFSLLSNRLSRTTVSWWCARWCPPFLRMGEVELGGGPHRLPAQELEGPGVRWEAGASAEGNPEAEETKEAALGTWNLWWSTCWRRGRGSWKTLERHRRAWEPLSSASASWDMRKSHFRGSCLLPCHRYASHTHTQTHTRISLSRFGSKTLCWWSKMQWARLWEYTLKCLSLQNKPMRQKEFVVTVHAGRRCSGNAPCCSTLISSRVFYHQCRWLIFSLLGQISFCSFSLFFESGLFICSLLCCKKLVFYLMIKIQRMAFSLLAQINGVFDVLFYLMCSSVSYLNSTKLIKSNQMLTINYT